MDGWGARGGLGLHWHSVVMSFYVRYEATSSVCTPCKIPL